MPKTKKHQTPEAVLEGFNSLPLLEQILVFKAIKTVLEEKKKEATTNLQKLNEAEK